MKSKEEKIYTYIVLLIGIIITYFYFYHLRGGYSRWDIDNTYFSQFWRKIVGNKYYKYDIGEGLWIFLQIFFLISWWYIRDDLVKLIKIIHSKI
jgi:hypothetical protein